ncbi:MAG: PaaI family thioesterase [Anaerolineae bacterium]|nr:PaaI family thioesterase [Anaerolineae bacterium]
MSEHNHDHQQPSSFMCFVCGVNNHDGLQVRFFNDGENAVRAEVSIDDRFQGFPGIAHGGVVAALLDEIVGRAGLSGNPNRLMYTGKLEVKYRQHVPLHTALTLKGRIDKDRGRIVQASGELYTADGAILAEATATLMELPDEVLKAIDIDKVGWKVVP